MTQIPPKALRLSALSGQFGVPGDHETSYTVPFRTFGDVMSNIAPEIPEIRGHVRVVYLGPVAPHWDVQSDYGDRALIEEFRQRVSARLLLLPPHDPQFRRNRERVVRDAEREGLELQWDLGVPEDEDGTA
jgi:hypothetical protein